MQMEMIMPKQKKNEFARFMALSDTEKDAKVAKYDKYPEGFVGHPLTTADKALHRVARNRAKVGRPMIGLDHDEPIPAGPVAV